MNICQWFSFGLVLFLSSCGHSSESKVPKDPMDISLPTTELNGKEAALVQGKYCYQYAHANDTFDIDFIVAPSKKISGSMVIKTTTTVPTFGGISGNIEGDIITFNYRFRVGDQLSIRNMNMKVRGNLLITGTGNEEAVGDSAFIRDKSSIQYDGIVYHSVDCR